MKSLFHEMTGWNDSNDNLGVNSNNFQFDSESLFAGEYVQLSKIFSA